MQSLAYISKHQKTVKCSYASGLDEITDGGIPKNRSTLLVGNSGSGKTVIAMNILVNGIVNFNQPGVFLAFEESKEELMMNVKSMKFDLDTHVSNKKLYIEQVTINPDEKRVTGKYDLEGLFIRLERAINSVKAKLIVLDSLDTLLYNLDYAILRSEFLRLVSWLKKKEVTAIITSETGNNFLTRMGIEEFVTDCVILLDNRVADQITTRRLRIIKFRGSIHGNNESGCYL